MIVHKNQVRPVSAIPEARSSQTTQEPQRWHRPTMQSVTSVMPSITVRGHYSIERLLALETYSCTKSHWHILWVVIWTPLVPVLIILAYQVPLLAPPEAGLQANWVYIGVRGGIGIAIICECCLKLIRSIAPELDTVLTFRMGLLYDVLTSVVYMALMVAFSTIWGFPVPFGPSIMNPITSVISMSALYNVVRPLLQQNQETKHRFMICVAYAAVFSLASVAYPAYMALFVAVGEHDPNYQPFVTFLIPITKLAMRKMMAYASHELEDLIPVVVIFSVEFFSALYQVMSVQTGSSIATTATVMAIDLTFTIRSQWKLHNLTRTLRELLDFTQAEALLPTVGAVCDDPQVLQSSSADERHLLRCIRLHTAVPSQTNTPKDQDRLEKINQSGIFSATRWNPTQERSNRRSKSRQLASRLFLALPPEVQPGTVVDSTSARTGAHASTRIASIPAINRDKRGAVVIEATSMLFRSELMLLAEYLECIIPLFYAGNTVLLWFSPNGQYSSPTGSIRTSDKLLLALLNIAPLFAMEVVSFVLLNWMLHKWLHFSPLHQLGFVLENQAAVIRANILFVLIMSLQFNLDHAGTDFSFQFKWLHTKDSNN